MLALMDSFMRIHRLNNDENFQNFTCAYCKEKHHVGYRYTCLECDDYELCNECFYRRKFNHSHKTGHKMLRFDSVSNNQFDDHFRKHELYLDYFLKKYENEIHTDVNCNICDTEPITGLRYKCSCCVDFDLCEKCSNKSHGKHFNSHPLITYCKSDEESEIDIAQIELGPVISTGGFGKIYQATHEGKNLMYKLIDAKLTKNLAKLDRESKLDHYTQELNLFREIIADNILKIIDYSTVKVGELGENLMVISEFMKRGSLGRVLREEPDLSFKIRFHIAMGIARGMEVIHRLGFTHGDIRPDNIFISRIYTPKIGDMGLSKIYPAPVGCRAYMPPEFYTGNYGQKLDVYSFGLTLNEIFLGIHIQTDERISIERECQLIYRPLVVNCIHPDPARRPDSREISDQLAFINTYINRELNKFRPDFHQAPLYFHMEIFQDLFAQSLAEYETKKACEYSDTKKLKLEKLHDFYMKELKFHEMINNSAEDSLVPRFLQKLSSIFWSRNDAENALLYAKKAVDSIVQLVKDENDDRVCLFKRYLALVYLKLAHKPSEAIKIYQRILTDLQPKLDDQTSRVHISLVHFQLGECFEKMNQLETALEHHLQSLQLRRSIYDHDNRYLIESVGKIKHLYSLLNRHKEYSDFRREESNMRKNLFKQKHPDREYFETFLIKGKDDHRPTWHYVQIENEEKYESLVKQTTGVSLNLTEYGKIIESGWGENPPSFVIKSINDTYDLDFVQFKRFKIGDVPVDDYFLEANQDHVLNDLYDELKIHYEFYNGEYNLEVAMILFNISRYYLIRLEDQSNTIKYSNKCMEICDTLKSSLARKLTADALMLIGRSYLYIEENYNEALGYFNKSLTIRLASYESNHAKIAFNYDYIGEAYFELNQYDKALEYYVKCEDIYKIVYENQANPLVCDLVKKLRKTYEKLEQPDKNEHYRNEEIRIKRELFKIKCPDQEYFDPILVRGKDRGRPAWHYVLVENEEKREQLIKHEQGTNLDLTRFGRVIQSGWGVHPSDAVIDEINKKYSCYPDYCLF